ncbi:MAG: aldo/keto reductase [Candidatus Hydrogenedentes bacterium]|nr:aldo/keto reductase [Candidatus Hydrogenedentota bacterium]
MQYRTLSSSDLSVSVISFGAWAIGGSMWGGTDDEAAIRAIRASLDLGVTCVDTAAIYGMGHSECVVGKAIAGRRDGVVVATKCGLRWDLEDGAFFFEGQTPEGEPRRIFRNLRPDSIRHECEQSLKRLGVDVIDLYQCHWPDPTSNLDDTMDALLDLQRQGKIRAIGVSNFTPDMMRQCLAKGVLASDQPKYNLIEREIEPEILPFCREHNIGILAYSPMAMGLLTGKMGPDHTFNGDDTRRNRPWFSVQNRQRVRDMLAKIKPIADDHGVTFGQLTLNWVISQPGLTTALAGARNEKQAAENLKAADFTLSESELATMRRCAEELGAPV